MNKKSLFFVLALSAASTFADEAEPEIFRPTKASEVHVVDTTNSNSIKLDVSIFGETAIGSYYILWSETDLSDEMKKILTSRDFRQDEFFMQNIDREQFEQERLLQLFEDKKREYFRIFPEEEEKDKKDKDNE
ncbi:MAG: hypothetical protein M0P13_03410 [Fibrobacteraceae bacterium]|nr:hypothetical protein [Fibrobacteraceae bacterium]